MMTMKRIQTAKPANEILPAPGIHEARTNVRLGILVTSLSKKRVVLHKPMCNSSGKGPPEGVMEPERNDGFKPTVEVNAVHYREVEDQQTQIERHIEVEH